MGATEEILRPFEREETRPITRQLHVRRIPPPGSLKRDSCLFFLFVEGVLTRTLAQTRSLCAVQPWRWSLPCETFTRIHQAAMSNTQNARYSMSMHAAINKF